MVRTCVARDPGPRPRPVATGSYLMTRPTTQIDREADVVQRYEPVPQKLILPYEMRQVGPAVAGTRFAGTPRVERPEVPAILGVLEVDAPILGQGRAVAGEARGEHAVEHVYPERYDLQDTDGVPDPHKIPGLLHRQPGRREGQRLEHLIPR